MTSLPRAACRVCGREVAVRVNGKLREHRAHHYATVLCPGSGKVTWFEPELADGFDEA